MIYTKKRSKISIKKGKKVLVIQSNKANKN